MYWLILCVNLTQAGVITEKGAFLEEMSHAIQLQGIFSISDQGRRAQPIVGGAIAGQVVLGSVRKQAEQARGSKPVSSTLP